MLSIRKLAAKVKFAANRSWTSSNPITITIALALFIMLVNLLASWDFYFTHTREFLLQILAELHGLVIDIVVLGLLSVWINRFTERNKTIQQCKMQISDLRTLKGDSVSLLLLMAIKTLSRNNVFDIDLHGISIPEAPLNGVNLSGANMAEGYSPRSSFADARLVGVNIQGADFERSDMLNADMSFCSGNIANFSNANLTKANLSFGKFINAKFRFASLNAATFQGSNLLAADFEGARLVGVDFRGCKELTSKQLRKAKVLLNCLFDEQLHNELVNISINTAATDETFFPILGRLQAQKS